MSENGLSMIDLVLTHLDHCWGPPCWYKSVQLAAAVLWRVHISWYSFIRGQELGPVIADPLKASGDKKGF